MNQSNNEDFSGRIIVQKNWNFNKAQIVPKKEKVFTSTNSEGEGLKTVEENKSRTRKNAFNPPLETFNIDDLIKKFTKVLKISVERDVLNLIKSGKLDVLVIKNTYQINIWKKLKYKNGDYKQYDFVQMSVGYGSDEKVVSKYRGFFIAGHSHTIKVGSSIVGVPEGSIIIKFGEEYRQD